MTRCVGFGCCGYRCKAGTAVGIGFVIYGGRRRAGMAVDVALCHAELDSASINLVINAFINPVLTLALLC